MGPEIPTAAADQNFAWICKQHQDLIGSVLSFRTKIIWSEPEFGLVRRGYLNAAMVISKNGTSQTQTDSISFLTLDNSYSAWPDPCQTGRFAVRTVVYKHYGLPCRSF